MDLNGFEWTLSGPSPSVRIDLPDEPENHAKEQEWRGIFDDFFPHYELELRAGSEKLSLIHI